MSRYIIRTVILPATIGIVVAVVIVHLTFWFVP